MAASLTDSLSDTVPAVVGGAAMAGSATRPTAAEKPGDTPTLSSSPQRASELLMRFLSKACLRHTGLSKEWFRMC